MALKHNLWKASIMSILNIISQNHNGDEGVTVNEGVAVTVWLTIGVGVKVARPSARKAISLVAPWWRSVWLLKR